MRRRELTRAQILLSRKRLRCENFLELRVVHLRAVEWSGVEWSGRGSVSQLMILSVSSSSSRVVAPFSSRQSPHSRSQFQGAMAHGVFLPRMAHGVFLPRLMCCFNHATSTHNIVLFRPSSVIPKLRTQLRSLCFDGGGGGAFGEASTEFANLSGGSKRRSQRADQGCCQEEGRSPWTQKPERH